MLILEWDKLHLTIVSTDATKSRRVSWPDGQRPTEMDSDFSKWLKEQLADFLSKEKKVSLLLPREDAILRHLELPPTPEDEVLDVVKLQTTMRSSVSLDQVDLDYLPLNVRLPLADELSASGHLRTVSNEEANALAGEVANKTLHVLVATISSSWIRGLSRILDGIGLELKHVTLSCCGHASLLRDVLGPTAQAAIVVERDGRVETTALADGQLLFAHSARVPHGARDENGLVTPIAMGAEISRGLFAARRIAPEFQPRRIIISSPSCDGESGKSLKAALTEQFECSIEDARSLLTESHLKPQLLSLIQSESSVHELVGCLGVALGLPDPCRLDFLHPRKPLPKPDYTRVKWIAGGSTALVACGVGLVWFQLVLSGMNQQLTELNVRKAELGTSLRNGVADQKQFVALKDWQQHAPRISVELTRQADVLPDTGRMLWTNWSITAGSGEVYGRLAATGLARSAGDVTDLGDRMAETKEYRIVPRELAGISKDPDYKQRFEIDATMLPPKPPAKPETGAASKAGDAKATEEKPVGDKSAGAKTSDASIPSPNSQKTAGMNHLNPPTSGDPS